VQVEQLENKVKGSTFAETRIRQAQNNNDNNNIYNESNNSKKIE
jgi:hypothetical protein